MSEAKASGDNPEQRPGEATAEGKRRAARRRFLVGGAVALPVIVSARRNAFAYHNDPGNVRAVGKSVCVSIGTPLSQVKKGKPSVWCDVDTGKKW